MIVTFNLPLPKILSNIAAVMKVGDEAEAERKYLEIKKKLKHNNLTDFIRETDQLAFKYNGSNLGNTSLFTYLPGNPPKNKPDTRLLKKGNHIIFNYI